MAETYHVLDWQALPATLAATLAAGLRDDSRVKMAAAETAVSVDTLLLATCADALKLLIWQNTKDGSRGRNPPKMMLDAIAPAKNKPADTVGFDSPAEFMVWRKSILNRGGTNGRDIG